MHKLYTFEYRLIWLYTWRQQAKKGKNPKKRVQMHHSCTLSGPKPPEKLIRQHLFHQRWRGGQGARKIRGIFPKARDKFLWNLELMTEFAIDFRNRTLYAEKQLG